MRLKSALLSAALFAAVPAASLLAQGKSPLDPETEKLSHEIFKQLVETNTTDSVGSVTAASEAMRKRLLDAGFAAEDLVLAGPNDRKMNLVARYRGKAASTLKPILIICHEDVVEAPQAEWATDPFKLVEKDGFFYGRGTQDMKDSDAILVTNFIRLKKQGFVPSRDFILALTADEEGGKSNGVDWLLKNRPELIKAEAALNPDSGGIDTESGKPVVMVLEATEKLYGDFELSTKNPGGHSSLPTKANAIYELTKALDRLEKYQFPVEINAVTRAYFEQMSSIERKRGNTQIADDMLAVLKSPPDLAAVTRLSESPRYNSTLRTTCVATMLSAGQAPNALPQFANANVNCRILPGHTQEETRQTLITVFAEPGVTVQYKDDGGTLFPVGTDRVSPTPPPLRADIFDPLKKVMAEMYPGLPILPQMETGASDSIYTMAAGVPSYGINGVGIDTDDMRAHARDERVNIRSYDRGVDFYYRYLQALGGK
ncbi:acetylornithine deacetylase/succinyl-diaminopimelate desuccinylase-like protein [Granulicella aggregans]|uniref:Acetylornithine deacetylase/succinyl-diaminopimelate desuccinylase-like protein n=1 Tax=Granulicella aggregans TaxID=474949 RepID=A0A7W7ZAF6_9BACT|nr:M20/M25/M40 family metallo-hydrolase [Granulicella aggregans]MBB5056142.1 acetylornithine deacetylase/succinyl-diaminopimelate desuccinylase-like protein [Granulicella aggregans]